MIMNMGYANCENKNLNKLRAGQIFPKEPAILTEKYEARCLTNIKKFVDTRRQVLKSKADGACIPDEDCSCFLVGDEIMLRYPIIPTSGSNRELARSRQDPDYKQPSVASEEADADNLQLPSELPGKPVEVSRGLHTELLFSTLLAGAPARSTHNTVRGHFGVYATGVG